MNEIQQKAKAGFVYDLEVFDRMPDGSLKSIGREVCRNLIPREGIDYMHLASFLGGTQFSNWYVGLYSANYIPAPGSTAANLPGEALEVSAYVSETRPKVIFGNPTNGQIDNSMNMIEIEFTQEVTVQGGFISNSSAKGSTVGVLGSVVRFASPKQLGVGGVIRLYVSQQITSE